MSIDAWHTVVPSVLGDLTLVRDQAGLRGLYFPHHWYKPQPSEFGRRADDGFDAATGQLEEYLAARLGGETTPQQVGAAVGRNPLSILIPCHRVIGRNGKLTGYAGGLARKRHLLELERDQVSRSLGMSQQESLIPVLY